MELGTIEWINELHNTIVGLDTAPLIYYIEEHPQYLPVVDPFFDALDRKELTVITSTITLLEVLVHPLRSNETALIAEYRDILLNTPNLTTFEVNSAIAEEAARLRAGHHLRAPDAIQLATAISGGASFFLTNDLRFPEIEHLKILVVDELMNGPLTPEDLLI